MRPPRPVSAAAAVGGHLPRHRGRRLPQPRGDHGEQLPGMQAHGDLLPVGHRQPPRPRHPPIRMHRPPRGMPHDQRDALMRAAHLRADLPQRQAPGLQPQRQPPLLHRQMWPHPQPPQLIENLLDSPRHCADPLNPPCQPSVGVGHDAALEPVRTISTASRAPAAPASGRPGSAPARVPRRPSAPDRRGIHLHRPGMARHSAVTGWQRCRVLRAGALRTRRRPRAARPNPTAAGAPPSRRWPRLQEQTGRPPRAGHPAAVEEPQIE